MLGKCCSPLQISWNETCDCPARKRAAPVLGNVNATKTKLQQTKPQHLNKYAEKENASDLDSVDRFDTQNLSSAFY